MPFNLNKAGQPASKFNLSKSDETPATDQKRARKGVWIATAILVIVLLGWYMLRKSPVVTIDGDFGNRPHGTHIAEETAKADVDSPGKESPDQQNRSVSTTFVNNSVTGSFDAGSFDLRFDPLVVNELLAILSKHPSRKILIKGYASSEGDAAFNRRLSKRRAESLKAYLIKKGIDSARIEVEGKGIENPISGNDSNKGRKKNRRVEVSFTN